MRPYPTWLGFAALCPWSVSPHCFVIGCCYKCGMKASGFLCWAALWLAFHPTASLGDDLEESGPAAGHSLHGEAFDEGPRQSALLMPGTGKVEIKITSRHPQAQAFFNQGVGQLHGFWYFEAERSFPGRIL